MDLQGFVVDNIGPFSPAAILNAVFAVLVAALLGHSLGRFGAGARGGGARVFAVWAAVSALALVFARTQLPLAVALLALVLLVRAREEAPGDKLVLAGAVVLGMGCGSGASLVTLVLAVPFILLVRWAYAGREVS